MWHNLEISENQQIKVMLPISAFHGEKFREIKTSQPTGHRKMISHMYMFPAPTRSDPPLSTRWYVIDCRKCLELPAITGR